MHRQGHRFSAILIHNPGQFGDESWSALGARPAFSIWIRPEQLNEPRPFDTGRTRDSITQEGPKILKHIAHGLRNVNRIIDHLIPML
jgi:hypothetical protein